MRQRVSFLQQYLSDHFHTGPYKHGENDPVVMAVKSLELLCTFTRGCICLNFDC